MVRYGTIVRIRAINPERYALTSARRRQAIFLADMLSTGSIPGEKFVALWEKAPPSVRGSRSMRAGTAELVSGWLRFFINEGLIKIEYPEEEQ